MVDLYCLSPFQGWYQLLVRSQWFRTTLRSVRHHWLPSVAPLALDLCLLQEPLKHIGHFLGRFAYIGLFDGLAHYNSHVEVFGFIHQSNRVIWK